MHRFAEKVKSNQAAWMICFVLALLVWGVFGQTLRYDFVNYDDDWYVYDNPTISNGLTVKGIVDIFTASKMGVYYPLAMLSLMTDAELYGLDAGGFHLTNALLHATTVILLFLVLHSMTGSLWRSAFVAAVFAIHPLRVESVAWITERKDVLSGLFFTLTLGAYVRYVRRPFSVWHYLTVLVFFALGLLSKPSLTPLPFGLLLFDRWPLGRFQNSPAATIPSSPASLRQVLVEKIPLLLLSILMSALTVFSHTQYEQSDGPLLWNLWNAAVSYAVYIGQSLWPFKLTVRYPHFGCDLPVWEIVLSLVVLAGISLAVFKTRKTRPYLLTGWLWYLGMLIPVIGIVRTLGGVAHADRFTYLPQIGLIIMATWLVTDWCASLRHRRTLLSAAAATVLSVLALAAHGQTRYWRDSISLWIHTLAHTKRNAMAHNNLGIALAEQGKTAAAIEHYQQALQINPRYADAHYNMGIDLAAQGKTAAAIEHFQQALQTSPRYADAHNNLGIALASQGKTAAAIEHYQQALQINPESAETLNNLGIALAAQGKTAAAIEHYQQALQINPRYTEAHNNLGVALAAQGRIDAAIKHYQQALQINPGLTESRKNMNKALLVLVRQGTALASQGRFGEAISCFEKILKFWPENAEVKNNLAWVLATCPDAALRNGLRAVELATAADRSSGGANATVLDTLAAACAEAGQYTNAVAAARRALEAAAGQESAAEGIRSRLRLYEAGIPYHEPEEQP